MLPDAPPLTVDLDEFFGASRHPTKPKKT